MPKTLYSDNYYYELYSTHITIYKYDIFDQAYIKVDQCSLFNIPKKYVEIIKLFKNDNISDMIVSLNNIKVSN
jgi:hypothetical protein